MPEKLLNAGGGPEIIGQSIFKCVAGTRTLRDQSRIRKQRFIRQAHSPAETLGAQTDEIEKLHNQLINDTVRMRQSAMSRAQTLAEFALYDGDPKLINSDLDELLAVTPEQISNAVSEYVKTENRSLLDVVPAGKG